MLVDELTRGKNKSKGEADDLNISPAERVPFCPFIQTRYFENGTSLLNIGAVVPQVRRPTCRYSPDFRASDVSKVKLVRSWAELLVHPP